MGFFRSGGMAIMMASLAVFGVAALAVFSMSSPAGAQDLGNCPPGYHTVFQQASNGPPQPSCAADGSGSGGSPSAPIRVLKKSFGALAYNAAAGGWAASRDQSTAGDAKAEAIGACQRGSGGSCQIMLSYTNQCAAVARALEGGVEKAGEDSANTGSSEDEAKRNAVNSCRADWNAASCTIVIASCSQHATRVVR